MTRWAIRRDLSQINVLVGSDQELMMAHPNVISIVHEVNAKIVGFMAYALKQDYALIWELCVSENERRKGYGTVLLKHIQKPMTKVRVSEHNLIAQLFFKKNGFIGKQRGVNIIFTKVSDNHN